MAKYRFIFEADSAKDRDALKKFLAGAEQPFTVETVKKKKEPKSRVDRLVRAELFAEEAKSIIEELCDEMEQWRDSIPENLQSGGKYSEVEECYDALDTIKSAFEEMDFNGVSFPGMY